MTNSRVGIIARGLTLGGVTRSITNILYEFNKLDLGNLYVFTDQQDYERIYPNLKVIYLKKRHKLIWDYLVLPSALKNYKIDICIFTKNVVPFPIKCKSIVIIYDLIHLKDPGVYRWTDAWYMKSILPHSAQKANAIITISENTKRELMKYTHVPDKKINVVYLAVEKRFKPITENEINILSGYKIQKPYILYVGSLSPRKNIIRLIKAYENLKQIYNIPHALILAGSKAWKEKEIYKLINKSKYKDSILNTGRIAENHLPCLYTLSDVFVYPSLYEGFGLPILEAQACGCPVVCSSTSSLPEIGADGVHKVNPYLVEDIQDGIYKVISDNDYKIKLIEKGYRNIKRFSWEKTAKEILDITYSCLS